MRDLSIVVQGPIHRTSAERWATPLVLDLLRRTFPVAEIVLSTWDGSELDGLTCDTIVTSPDPGNFPHPFGWHVNVNRMIVSTQAGLTAATGTHVLKTRTDVLITSPAITANPDSLEQRVRVGSIATRNILTTFMPFHVSDILQFGRTADLRRWWNVPLTHASEYFLPLGHLSLRRPERHNAEQYIFAHRSGATLHGIFDNRPEIVRASLAAMFAAIEVVDEMPAGIALPTHIPLAVPPWQRHDATTFADLRAWWHRAPAEVLANYTARRQHAEALLAKAPPDMRFI